MCLTSCAHAMPQRVARRDRQEASYLEAVSNLRTQFSVMIEEIAGRKEALEKDRQAREQRLKHF